MFGRSRMSPASLGTAVDELGNDSGFAIHLKDPSVNSTTMLERSADEAFVDTASRSIAKDRTGGG